MHFSWSSWTTGVGCSTTKSAKSGALNATNARLRHAICGSCRFSQEEETAIRRLRRFAQRGCDPRPTETQRIRNRLPQNLLRLRRLERFAVQTAESWSSSSRPLLKETPPENPESDPFAWAQTICSHAEPVRGASKRASPKGPARCGPYGHGSLSPVPQHGQAAEDK